MKLKTKFNVGDKVYHLNDNKVCHSAVDAIDVYVRKDEIFINYNLVISEIAFEAMQFGEEKCFSTIDELLASLRPLEEHN